MSHIAVIVGISGLERYLAEGPTETTERGLARRFKAERGAKEAAEEHIGKFARVIRAQMRYRIEPARGECQP